MTHKGTVILLTNRLKLRRYQQGDQQQMHDNFLSDTKVTEHVNWESHTNLKMTEDFLQMHLEKYNEINFYGWAIEMNGKVIGSIGAFHIDDTIKSCEIGYSLGSKYWGQGIITEAVTAVLDFLFREVEFNRITASYNEENIASGKVMKKVGMSYEGTCKEAVK